MSAGPSRVYEYVQDRRYSGQMADPSVVGRSSLAGQPPQVTLYLKLTDQSVSDARFQTSGCGFLMACCAAVIELSLQRDRHDCQQIEPAQVVAHLGGLPVNRLFCAELAVAALRDALSQLATSSPGSDLP